MSKKWPNISTIFFIIAMELLVCSLAVSILVWIGDNLSDRLPGTSWLLDFFWFPAVAFISWAVLLLAAFFPYFIGPADKIGFPRHRALSTFLAYWLSVVAFFIFVVGIIRPFLHGDSLMGAHLFNIPEHYWSRDGQILPWAMALLSILLFAVNFCSEHLLLKASKRWNSFAPGRIILYHRFVVLGSQISRLNSGWPSIAVRFIDVILAAWLAQSLSRIIWQMTELSIFKVSYRETLLSPTDPSNGSIFNSFLMTNQSTLLPIDFLGRHFAPDIASSLFSLLWHHSGELVAVWFVLEALVYIWNSSGRVVIVNGPEGGGSEREKSSDSKNAEKKNGEKGAFLKAEPLGSNLADLLAAKLQRIGEIYRSVDEKKPVQSACGAGEPIDAAIKVDRLEDVTLSSSSEFKLGPLSIPASSVSALISHILRGPKITISLYIREQSGQLEKKEDETGSQSSRESGRFVLTATMTAKRGSYRWIVDSPDPLKNRSSERTVEDMVVEMSHRIFATIQSERSGPVIPWKAMYNFNEGMRAYRDCLLTTKKRKYFLNLAEKKFIDALEEHNSFGLAYYNLGVVYLALNQPDSAEASFLKAIEMQPDSWEAYYALGIALFRRTKAFEESFKILDVCMEKKDEIWAKDNYTRVTELCDRVLELKIREERFLEKNFAIKAKANDLKGNALVRLAFMRITDTTAMPDAAAKADKSNRFCYEHKERCGELKEAEVFLKNAVHYAWMALIRESVMKETSKDESEIVCESTIDLADAYLKMCERAACGDKLLRQTLLCNAMSMLFQASIVRPDDVNLYHLLADASDSNGCSILAHHAYNKIKHINPDCPRVKAHLALYEARNKKSGGEPTSWIESCLRKCESMGCCDAEAYAGAYHLLYDSIGDEACTESRKLCIEREKLEAELHEVAEKSDRAILALTEREMDRRNTNRDRDRDRLRVGLAIANLDIDKAFGEDFKKALTDIINYTGIIKGSQEFTCPVKELVSNAQGNSIGSKIINYLEDILAVGSVFLELARRNYSAYVSGFDKKEVLKIDREINKLIGNIAEDNEAYVSMNFNDKSIFKINSKKFCNLSQICLICAKNILLRGKILFGFDIFSHEQYTYHYMIEAGKMLLELGKIKRGLNEDDAECNKCAMELFEKVKDALEYSDPEYIKRNKIRLHLARAYLACNELHKAIREAQKAKDLNPLDYEERKLLGEIFCRLKEFKYGLSELNAALSYRPDDADLLLCTGKAYFKAGKDCRKRGEDRNRILSTAREKLDEALEIIDKPKIRERGQVRYWIGRTVLEMGRYEEAIPHLRILAENDDGGYLPELYLGYAYMKCNTHEECESVLFKLIRRIKSKGLEDAFCGQQYGEERHFGEILARAYVYLAYSYAERDANLCDSWKLAYESQKYIMTLREADLKEAERARDGVLPEVLLDWNKIDGRGEDSKKLKDILARTYKYEWEKDASIAKVNDMVQIYIKGKSLSLNYDSKGPSFILNEGDTTKGKFSAVKENDKLYLSLPVISDLSYMDDKCRSSFHSAPPVPATSPAAQKDAQTQSSDPPKVEGSTSARLWDGYAIDGMDNFKISIIFNPKDGLRKRKSKAHLAECAGTICYKMGDLDAAIDYLRASIALYPDAGAYINLARAYERMLLCEKDGKYGKPKKAFINRMIRDLCRHAEALDLRDEHKKDLEYFKKVCREREKGSSASPAEPSGSVPSPEEPKSVQPVAEKADMASSGPAR